MVDDVVLVTWVVAFLLLFAGFVVWRLRKRRGR